MKLLINFTLTILISLPILGNLPKLIPVSEGVIEAAGSHNSITYNIRCLIWN